MKMLKRSFLLVLLCVCLAFGFACMQPSGESSLSSESNSSSDLSTLNVLKSISVSNYKTDFEYGEDFSVGNLVVTATYRDGTTKKVTGYSVDSKAYDKTTPGKYTITVQYVDEGTACEATYTVTVGYSADVVGIQLKGQRTVFAYGEEFSFPGIVQQEYADGRLFLATDYTVDSSKYNKDVVGEYEITVAWGDFAQTFTVKVSPSTIIASYEVIVQTTEFTIGDSFAFDGAVRIEYTDGRVEENSDNYTVDCSNYQAYKIGSYEVKLLIGGDEYSYEVSVEKANSLKILMIGNSYADDTRYYVPWMAEALDFEEVIVGSLYIGGCSVKTHYENSVLNTAAYDFRCYENNRWNDFVGGEGTKQTMEYAIKYEDWDYITIQQASVDSGKAATYNSDLDNLVSYVKQTATNKDVKLIWNMTWAYREGYSVLADHYENSQMVMYNAITNAVQTKIETNAEFDLVLPAGTAVQNARTSYIGDDFNMDDGTHLNFYRGRYIAGLTMFCSLTGYSPDEVTYAPSSLTVGEILVAKESVKNALANKYSVTNSQYVEEP